MKMTCSHYGLKQQPLQMPFSNVALMKFIALSDIEPWKHGKKEQDILKEEAHRSLGMIFTS